MLIGLAESNSESVVPGGRRDEETFLQAASTIIRPEAAAASHDHVRSDLLKRLPGSTRATRKHTVSIYYRIIPATVLYQQHRYRCKVKRHTKYMKPCPADTILLGTSFLDLRGT